jgi:error-prone DNA polymerase
MASSADSHADIPAYAELHCISNYSFLRGASHPAELVARAAALGYAALALTDECSVAGVVRAHVAARNHPVQLIIGSELRLADGLHLVLLATSREDYAALCALITRGRRAAAKGSYHLLRADLEALGAACLALWIPAEDPQLADATWLQQHFAGRVWLAVELHAGGGDRQRVRQLTTFAAAAGMPAVAAGDVHMHVRGRRALQDTLTAIRTGQPLGTTSRILHANGERHLRGRAALARIYPADLLANTLEIARRCSFSLDELQYQYPQELVPAGHTPASWVARTLAGWCAGAGHAAGGARTGPDRGAALRSLFPDRVRHRVFRPQSRHPLPGAGIGGKFRRVFLPGDHGSRPGPDVDALRALHVPGAERAAGHRCGLRARAA